MQLISLSLDLSDNVETRIEEPVHAVLETACFAFGKFRRDTAGDAPRVRLSLDECKSWLTSSNLDVSLHGHEIIKAHMCLSARGPWLGALLWSAFLVSLVLCCMEEDPLTPAQGTLRALSTRQFSPIATTK